jgi:predicted phage-related endonuclease
MTVKDVAGRLGRDPEENYILKDVMLAPLGIDNEDDLITGMFEGARRMLTLGEREHDLCAEHVPLSKRIKDMEERKKAIAVTLKEAIIKSGEQGGGELKAQARAGACSISWSRFSRSSVDSGALKRDGLYEKYARVSESGRFTVTEKKGTASC